MTRVMCSHSIEAPIPSRVKSRPPHIEHESEAAETPERVLTRNTNRRERRRKYIASCWCCGKSKIKSYAEDDKAIAFTVSSSIAHTAITGTQARGMV